MFIFSKRRILFIILAVIMSVSIPYINLKNKTAEVVALPVSNRVIVLDAGHGFPDEGAKGVNGTTENKINLQIVLKVQSLLEQSGAIVILTRSDENGIYDLDKNTLRDKKVSDMKNRVKIGNNSEADIFVSVHLNKIPQSQYFGWQTFFKKNDEKSIKLARSIQKNLNESMQKENHREALSISNKYIVDNVEIPITIVECGFLSNPTEEALLKTDEYQNRIAWGIYSGIMDYFYE